MSIDASTLDREPLVVRTPDLSLARPPRWAWNGRIVQGSLNLILGAEGVGKGTLAAWLISKLTRGELPGSLEGEPVAVGLIGDEDSLNDVWTPRLHAAGADLTLVKSIEKPDSYIEIAAEHDELARTISEHEIRVLWCDALLDNLGAIDDWRAKQVRDALAPLRRLARDHDVAAIGAMHPNKSGVNFRQLVAGSVAFNALSRSSLLLAAHPDDADCRVIVRGKGNLARTPEALTFRIETKRFTQNGFGFAVPRAVDFKASDLSVDDLIGAHSAAPAPVGEARSDARTIVAEQLADGDWHPANDIIARCEAQGIYKRAAQRAADDLGVERERRGFPAASYWRQSRHSSDTRTTVAAVTTVTAVAPSQTADLAWIGRGDSNDSSDSPQACRSRCHDSEASLRHRVAELSELPADLAEQRWQELEAEHANRDKPLTTDQSR